MGSNLPPSLVLCCVFNDVAIILPKGRWDRVNMTAHNDIGNYKRSVARLHLSIHNVYSFLATPPSLTPKVTGEGQWQWSGAHPQGPFELPKGRRDSGSASYVKRFKTFGKGVWSRRPAFGTAASAFNIPP